MQMPGWQPMLCTLPEKPVSTCLIGSNPQQEFLIARGSVSTLPPNASSPSATALRHLKNRNLFTPPATARVVGVIPTANSGVFLIAIAYDALRLRQEGKLTPCPTLEDKGLKKGGIYSIVHLADGRFIITSLMDDVRIFDAQDQLILTARQPPESV